MELNVEGVLKALENILEPEIKKDIVNLGLVTSAIVKEIRFLSPFMLIIPPCIVRTE